ncbi:MAG: response regulator transcription factor [Spirochaetaceae bacterium]|jgi:two-component system response regulator RegX3|nr:response regulator transcription factor [Spirochaetaceae bacterium]
MKGDVLIIEDVRELSELVSLYLTKEGLDVQAVESAEEGLVMLETRQPDLIILDLNLPGMDGFEFLQTLRRRSGIPVIIVSARNSDEDLISGFSTGADEFVTKPFSPRVLAARVRALLQRIRRIQEEAPGKSFRFGPFTLDFDACVLKKNDEKIQLSAKEYEVLSYLARHAGRPSGPEQIYNECWQNNYGDLTTVAVYIQRLRKKIEDNPAEPAYIETVHGMGYRLNTGEEGP